MHFNEQSQSTHISCDQQEAVPRPEDTDHSSLIKDYSHCIHIDSNTPLNHYQVNF